MKLDLAIMNRSLDEFFEPDRARALRAKIQNRSAFEREEIILAAVESSITDAGGIPLHFGFKSDQGRRSHYLVYASKNQKAAGMMKSILRSASPEVTESVGSGGREVGFGILLEEEAQIRYTESNYRDALLKLEVDGRVVVDPPA